MLTCNRLVASLCDYLDDDLDAAARSQFELHMERCRRCRIVVETTCKTVELYKKCLPCRMPVAVESRLIAAIRSRLPVKH